MKSNKTALRNAHFLGTKIRNLRKNNNLTMEDLSSRCVKINAEQAPSVSYLSMIERGKRIPSIEMLNVIAKVFEKESNWFLDNNAETSIIAPEKGNKGGIKGIPLEPGFLFEKENLQIAIPELLSQAGVTGREFAHLLIRAHQEQHQNRFPDLERAAEDVGQKRMPISIDELIDICKKLGIKIKWFTSLPASFLEACGAPPDADVRSIFEQPNIIHLNDILKKHPSRLRYDLAAHIGNCVLHSGEGLNNVLFTTKAGSLLDSGIGNSLEGSSNVDAQEILQAWRDFECSFFAGALLCPKIPFRRLLEEEAHEFSIADKLNVSASVAMRRMTSVSSYTHWHYFDAYPPGKLKAVYRGNGIPLPWGNMRMVQDPCQHWAVFRMLDTNPKGTSAQISILDKKDGAHIYACESLKVKDLANIEHVLCAGIDINPALDAQGLNAQEVAEELKQACVSNGGTMVIPKAPKQALTTVGSILNIAWLKRGIEKEARLICPRSNQCPRKPHCVN